MTSRVSKLVVAALLLGSVPALAAAHDRDDDCDHDREVRPVVVTPPVYAPPPAYGPPGYAPPPAYAPAPPAWERWGEGRWGERRWQEARWRHRELEAVRGELAALEAQRADFHAQNAWRPGKLRRYDRWYFEQRAELLDRLNRLERVAWR